MDWTKGSKWRSTAKIVLRDVSAAALMRLLKNRAAAFARQAAALGSSGSVTAAKLLIVLQRDDWRCLACGSERDLCFDHLTSLLQRGRNTADNLQTLCRRCNASKTGLSLTVWRQIHSLGLPWAHTGYMVWCGDKKLLQPQE
jgi:hypothetical protein